MLHHSAKTVVAAALEAATQEGRSYPAQVFWADGTETVVDLTPEGVEVATEPEEAIQGARPDVLLMRFGWPWFAIEVVVTHPPTPQAANAIGEAGACLLVVQPTWADLGELARGVRGVAYKPQEQLLEDGR